MWEAHKFEIVVAGNVAKFGQNPALREYLLSIGDTVPVEADPYDVIRGVKLPINSPDLVDPRFCAAKTCRVSPVWKHGTLRVRS